MKLQDEARLHVQRQYSHTVLFLLPSKVKPVKAELKHSNESPSPLQVYRSQNTLFGLNIDRNYTLNAAEALQS